MTKLQETIAVIDKLETAYIEELKKLLWLQYYLSYEVKNVPEKYLQMLDEIVKNHEEMWWIVGKLGMGLSEETAKVDLPHKNYPHDDDDSLFGIGIT